MLLWSPYAYVLLLARLLDEFGVGLSVSILPICIPETALSKMKGLLNMFPPFIGSDGIFLSHFVISLLRTHEQDQYPSLSLLQWVSQ